jgi:hypothetical protein
VAAVAVGEIEGGFVEAGGRGYLDGQAGEDVYEVVAFDLGQLAFADPLADDVGDLDRHMWWSDDGVAVGAELAGEGESR